MVIMLDKTVERRKFMKFIVKLLCGFALLLLVCSYMIDSAPVSNVLQSGQQRVDPLVTGAKTVKQELTTLTDIRHQAAYKQALQQGIRKAADLLNSLADGSNQSSSRPSADSSKQYNSNL